MTEGLLIIFEIADLSQTCHVKFLGSETAGERTLAQLYRRALELHCLLCCVLADWRTAVWDGEDMLLKFSPSCLLSEG